MRLTHALLFLFFAVLSLALFARALGGEFIMDDWGYITENAWVTQNSTPWPFWTTFNQTDYWPLTYTIYWLLFKALGAEPFGYHIVNVLLHALNGALVFVLARDLKIRWPLWAALLFLVHPLHVQAVAWIVQLKTLLATLLALLVLLAYLRKKYLAALLLFAAALLAKTSVIFLPLVLWAFEWNSPRRGWWRLIPFFILGVAGGWITVHVNELNFHERLAGVFHMDLAERILLVIQNLIFYPKLFFWPASLAYMYPLKVPEIYGPGLWLVPAALLILSLILAAVFYRPWREFRVFVFGYLVLLAPALGFVAIPNMKLSLVADHWAYLPDVFMALFLGKLAQVPDTRAWRLALLTPLLVLGVLTFRQASTFATEIHFWQRAREVNPHHPAPYYNLGVAYGKKEDVEASIEQYKLTLQRDPMHHRAWFNLGRAYFLTQEFEKSEECFLQAIQIDPALTDGYLALATVYLKVGSPERARAILEQGLNLNPGHLALQKRLNEIH